MNKKKESIIKIEEPHILAKAEEHSNENKKSALGRKKKPASEKESELIQLKITVTEFEALEKKRGITPMATYIKHRLRGETDILK